jgi:hypothetical protein
MINEAMKTPKGLAYTVVGSSTLTVEEVVHVLITMIL